KLGLPEPAKDVKPEDLLQAPAPPPDPFAARAAREEEPPPEETPKPGRQVAPNAQRGSTAEGDELDALVERMLDGWEPSEGELTQPFLDAIQEAESEEE